MAAVLSRPAADWRVLVFTKPPAFDESGFKSEGGLQVPELIGAYLFSLIRAQTFYVWGIGKIKILRKPQSVNTGRGCCQRKWGTEDCCLKTKTSWEQF